MTLETVIERTQDQLHNLFRLVECRGKKHGRVGIRRRAVKCAMVK